MQYYNAEKYDRKQTTNKKIQQRTVGEDKNKKELTRVHTRRRVARFAVWWSWKNGAVFDVGLLLVGHPDTV